MKSINDYNDWLARAKESNPEKSENALTDFYIKKHGGVDGLEAPRSSAENDPYYEYIRKQRAQTSGKEEQGLIGNVFDSFQEGAYQGLSGLGETFEQLFGVGEDLRDWAQEQADAQEDTMSEVWRESRHKEIFSEDENGDLILGEGATDYRTWLAQFGNMAGQMADMMVPGGVLGKAVRMGGKSIAAAKAAKKAQAIVEKSGRKLSPELLARYQQRARSVFEKKAGTAINTTAFGVTEAAVAGGQSGIQARDTVLNLSPEKKAKSETYQRLLQEHNGDDVAATQELAELTATAVQSNPTLITANIVLGAWGGATLEKILKGTLAKSRLSGAAKGFAIEGLSEGPQGGIEQYSVNKAVQEIADPSQRKMEGVVPATFNEAIMGGGMGGVGGAAARPKRNDTLDDIKDKLVGDIEGDKLNAAAGVVTSSGNVVPGTPVAQEIINNEFDAVSPELTGNEAPINNDPTIMQVDGALAQEELQGLPVNQEIIDDTQTERSVPPRYETAPTINNRHSLIGKTKRLAEQESAEPSSALINTAIKKYSESPKKPSLEDIQRDLEVDSNTATKIYKNLFDLSDNSSVSSEIIKDINSSENPPSLLPNNKNLIDQAAHEAATSPENNRTEPTLAQKEAENYKTGDIPNELVGGLDVKIENPKGSSRFKIDTDKLKQLAEKYKGVASVLVDLKDSGKIESAFNKLKALSKSIPALKPILDNGWHNQMKSHYGKFTGTIGADGDAVDVFLGDNAHDGSFPVFIIDQNNREGKFDEVKVMVGFKDEASARQGYLENYDKGWNGLGAISEVSQDGLKDWLKNGNTKARFKKITIKKETIKSKTTPESEISDGVKSETTKSLQLNSQTVTKTTEEAQKVTESKKPETQDILVSGVQNDNEAPQKPAKMTTADDSASKTAESEKQADSSVKDEEQANTILDAANVTGTDRLDAISKFRDGTYTLDDLRAAYPTVAKNEAVETKVDKAKPDAIDALKTELKSKYPDVKVSINTSGENGLVVNKVIVPEESRDKGVGTKFMRDIIYYADTNGLTVALTPSTDFGGTKSRLVKFYKSLGFVDNKGKNKDFEFQETMIRVPESKPSKETKKELNTDNYTPDTHKEVMDRVAEGNITAVEFKNAFSDLIANEGSITEELSHLTKAKLLEQFNIMGVHRYKNEKKEHIVDAIYREMESGFVLSDSYSFGFGSGSRLNAIQEIVGKQTNKSIKEYSDGIKKNAKKIKAEHDKAMAGVADPKTYDDFYRYATLKMQDEGMTFTEARMTLTVEQREEMDKTFGSSTRDKRLENINESKNTISVAGELTGAKLVETKHTRDGHDLFVIVPDDRVSKEDYRTWLSAAKKMGGFYSRFRGNGATPGFQFKEKDSAEAFLDYITGGDTDAVKAKAEQRRDAFADDKSQSAVERLNEMADKLEARGIEGKNQDRKTNTARRAGMAAGAIANAEYEIALADTMRKIATAIDSGKANFLNLVRTKAQVEMLNGFLTSSKHKQIRETYPNYVDQEKHKGEPVDKETVEFAGWPTYTAFRSDLARLGRQLLEIDGVKKIGKNILKVADDVSSEYIEFAKNHLNEVSTFQNKDGGKAVFKSKPMAEKSIAGSGFRGQAVVLPFKRGENIIILSPSEAIKRGIWEGDNDKRITLSAEFMSGLIGKSRRNNNVDVPWQFESVHEKRTRLDSMQIKTPAEFRAALREFVDLRKEPEKPSKVQELERSMVGRTKDGLDFFPTPEGTADEMVEIAGIEEGMSVLEPSAGWGHIAERIRQTGVEPDVIEMGNSRSELLEAKGFNVIGRDFMELDSKPNSDPELNKLELERDALNEQRVKLVNDGASKAKRINLDEKAEDLSARIKQGRGDLKGKKSGYDRIIMNPPFSDRRDAEHVKHAYSLLNDNGRLVAIVGEGLFFGKDKKAVAFREWLDDVGGSEEKLSDGTFQDPSLPVNTGVNARMIVIDKSSAKFSQSTGKRPGMPVKSAQSSVDSIRSTWNNAPKVTVVEKQSDLPKTILDQAKKDDVIDGVFDNGQVYIVADNIKNQEHLEFTLLHESQLHYGMRQTFGKQEFDKILKAIYTLNPEVRLTASEKMIDLGIDKLTAIEEVLADMAGNGKAESLNGWKRLVKFIKEWLAKNGFTKLDELANKEFEDVTAKDKFIGDALIQYVLSASKDAVVDGKSSIQENRQALFSAQAADIAIADTFYSQMERVLEQKLQGKGSGSSFNQSIKSFLKKGDFKQEEYEWSGINEWLTENAFKKLTKADVLNFIKANQVEIEEVQKGGSGGSGLAADIERIKTSLGMSGIRVSINFYGEITGIYARNGGIVYFVNSDEDNGLFPDYDPEYGVAIQDVELDKDLLREALSEGGVASNEEIEKDITDLFEAVSEQKYNDDIGELDSGDTKYHDYVLPGGKEYTELLLTLPIYADSSRGWQDYRDEMIVTEGVNPLAADEVRRYLLGAPVDGIDMQEVDNVRDRMGDDFFDRYKAVLNDKTRRKVSEISYQSSHFKEKNILAHVRYNERTDSGGKRVLFLEELQSDWHQDGRKDGYAPKTEAEVRAKHDADRIKNGLSEEAFGWDSLTGEQQRNVYRQRGAIGIPNAPFKTSWQMLIMKRMIRHASENGFDRIAWTTGDQQNERYKLSNHIDTVNVARLESGIYSLDAEKDGNLVFSNKKLNESEMKDLVGVELTKKIVADDGVQNRFVTSFAGLDLETGGEGMRGFYDNMLPKMVNKYVKKWGAKVGQSKININQDIPSFETYKSQEGFLPNENPSWLRKKYDEEINNTEVHSLDITDKMRDSVMQGQPLFNREAANESTPEFLKSQSGDGSEFVDNDEIPEMLKPQSGSSFKQTDTPAFKKWFGDSKVVDEDGEPLIVYHGTSNEFDAFDKDKIGSNYDVDEEGFFFSSSKESAEYSATESAHKNEDDNAEGITLPVYLAMDNPLIITAGIEYEAEFGKGNAENVFDQNKSSILADIDDGGHDGLVVIGNDEYGTMYMALEPTQIKSATGNNGEFSPDSDNIMFSRSSNNEGDSGLGDITIKPIKLINLDIKKVLGNIGVQAVTVKGGNSDELRAVAKRFGKKVVFYKAVEREKGNTKEVESGKQEFDSGNNAADGRGQGVNEGEYADTNIQTQKRDAGRLPNGFHSGYKSNIDKVFVNVDTTSNAMFIVGHELGHNLRTDDKALWLETVEAIDSLVEKGAFESYAKNSVEAENFGDLNADNTIDYYEEFVSDIIGRYFIEPRFWRELSQENQSLFMKLAKKALRYLSDLTSVTFPENAKIGAYLTDVNKARDVIVKSMAQYASNSEKGKYETIAKQDGNIRFSRSAGNTGLGDVTIAPKKVSAKIQSVLNQENATAVNVTGGNVDALRKITKLFGKEIIFFEQNAEESGTASKRRGKHRLQETDEPTATETEVYGRGRSGQGAADVEMGTGKDKEVELQPGRTQSKQAGNEESESISSQYITNGFANKDIKNVIFINASAPEPVLFIAGHEIGHQLRNEDPALWVKTVKALSPFTKNMGAYKKNNAENVDVNDVDFYTEEFISDVIGNNFLDENFWQAFSQQNESLFKKVARKAISILNKIFNLRLNESLVTAPYLTDVTQARAIIAKTMSQYAANIEKGTYKKMASEYDSTYENKRSRTRKQSNKNKAASSGFSIPGRGDNETLDNFIDAFESATSVAKQQRWGLLTMEQVVRVITKYLPRLKENFITEIRQMEITKNKWKDIAGKLAENRRGFGKQRSEQLSNVQHEATIAGVDPSKGHFIQKVDIDEANKKIKVHQQRMRELGGDSQARATIQKQIDDLKMSIGKEINREKAYPAIESMWNGLDSKQKTQFEEEREFHKDLFKAQREALIQRVLDSEMDEHISKSLAGKLQTEFENNQVEEPYFPLARFGDYFVLAKVNGEKTFDMFSSEAAKKRFIAQVEAKKGGKVLAHGLKMKDYNKITDIDSSFLVDVDEKIATLGNHPDVQAIRDGVYQLYLQSLPGMSSRKSQIHRSNVRGFHKDQLQGFADAAVHGANNLAKMKHGHFLRGELERSQELIDLAGSQAKMDAMNEEIADLQAGIDNAEEGTPVGKEKAKIKALKEKLKAAKVIKKADKVDYLTPAITELRGSYDALMNPRTSSIATNINALGFVYFIGASISSAVVNLTQTPVIAYPMMASKFGYGAATKALKSAYVDFAKGKGSIESRLSPDELDAYHFWHDTGLLSNTLSNDLAGMSDDGINTGGFKHKFMKTVAYAFQKAEVINREVTALAAYRAAKAKGKTNQQAMDISEELTWQAHFDYSSTNRARFMRGNFARVALQFRQYSQNITFLYAKTINDAFRNEPPEVKKEAKKLLFGMVTGQLFVAGSLSLPASSLVIGVIQALTDAFDDDDEFVDVKGEYRAYLASTWLGETGGEFVSKGFFNAFTPLNISGRLSLNDLWLRSSDNDLEGRAHSYDLLKNILGPSASIFEGLVVGTDLIAQGKVQRGFEKMLPKALKDGMKAMRFATDDAQTMSGRTIKEMDVIDALAQAVGFSNSELSEIYEKQTTVRNISKKRSHRRSDLIDAMIQAKDDKSLMAIGKARQAIQAWNRKHPASKISNNSIRNRKSGLKRVTDSMQDGIYVKKSNRDLVEKYDY